MKRIITLLMAVVMIIFCFSACDDKGFDPDEPITLRVCVESMFVECKLDDELEDLVQYFYPGISLEFDTISSTDLQKRENQLSRLRTEIVAGKGPDIFLLSTYQLSYSEDTEPLFVDVEKTMRNRIFLPLNEYIAESEHYVPEEHLKIVMDAGKLDGEQLVLPLLYSVSHKLYDAEKVAGLEFPTWDNVSNCGDPTLINSLGTRFVEFNRIFDSLANYDDLELSITEEELLRYLKLNYGIYMLEDAEDLGFDTDIGGNMNEAYLQNIRFLPGAPYVHPQYNVSGGVTAFVEAFAAINANTKYPEAAFKVIEFLFSDEIQSNRGFEAVGGSLLCPHSLAYKAYQGVATGKTAYRDPVLYKEGFLDSINEKITNVRFNSELDKVIYDMNMEIWDEVLDSQWREPDIDFEKYVSECYSDMKMMIAE